MLFHWTLLSEAIREDCQYHLDISSVSEEAGFTTYDIAIYSNDDTECIYSLQTAAYRQYTP